MISSQSERSCPSSAEENIPSPPPPSSHCVGVCFLGPLHIQVPGELWVAHSQPGPALAGPTKDPVACRASQKTTFAAALFQVRFILNHIVTKREDNLTSGPGWWRLLSHQRKLLPWRGLPSALSSPLLLTQHHLGQASPSTAQS